MRKLREAMRADRQGWPRPDPRPSRAVGILLRDEEWSKKSDRWIAEKAAVSGTLVARMRPELNCNTVAVESEPAAPPPRIGKDGKTRALPSKPVAEPKPFVSKYNPAKAPSHRERRDEQPSCMPVPRPVARQW